MKDEIPKKASTRTICACLEDMRSCLKTNNFSYFPGLIEEIQYRANRMENALELTGGWDGVPDKIKERDKLKKEIKVLEEEKLKLEQEKLPNSLDTSSEK